MRSFLQKSACLFLSLLYTNSMIEYLKYGFEAIVYGYRNIINYKKYIGYHLTDDINDGYIFSSDDIELREAWSRGHLRRSILFRGKKEDCITYERKLLEHVDARNNPEFYNKSNGGGAGMYDYNEISDEEAKIGIDWIDGIDPDEEIDVFGFVDQDLVLSIWENIQEGTYYEVIETPTDDIQKFERNQVRETMLVHSHVEGIADYMMDDPAKARENISPIIACVSEDGTQTIIDGNHTSQAIVRAGWTSAPVIYINQSEFLDKKSNINHFGYIANHNPKIKKTNAKEDCKRAIIGLYMDNLAENDEGFKSLNSDKFKDTCVETLRCMWTKNQISRNVELARAQIITDYAQANLNFQLYTNTETSTILQEIERKHPHRAVISITSGRMYNNGVGAIVNKMGGMDTWEGTIVARHGNYLEHQDENASLEKLKAAIERLHPNCKLSLILLDSFDKSKEPKEIFF